MLELKNIVKIFPGVRAVDDVSFCVKKGEVHAIVGENGAGKSTLINVIAGNYTPDSGSMILNGEKLVLKNYHAAINRGISVVYQERSLFANLSIAENIFADKYPLNKLGIISYKKLYEKSENICTKLNLSFDQNKLISDLSPADQQMVEIAKALSNDSQLIVFDEPTATITEEETRILFRVINELRKSGKSIIYISHRLKEIFEIADRVTVLKDGKYITTKLIKETNIESLVKAMVGRDLYTDNHTDFKGKELVLECKGLNSKNFSDINFVLKKGEILSFSGLAGAGRTELARSIIGIDPLQSGIVIVKNKKVKIKNPVEAIKFGIGYLPEDRKEQGLFLEMSVAENIVSGSLDLISKQGFINDKLGIEKSIKYKEKLNIVTENIDTIVKTLSGGNQQKVVFAKWLLVNPEILIIDEPTRGIDVGTKVEIYRIIRELSSKGVSIIVISSDLAEVLTISDRIVVMHEGRINGTLLRNEATEERVMHLASGINDNKKG